MYRLQAEGVTAGRYIVRSLMREAQLVCKQPGAHRYKPAHHERPDIPNRLNRQFKVERPNQVWCGDITYISAAGGWHDLAVELDLYAQRVVGWVCSDTEDATLVSRALAHAYQVRGQPNGVLFHSDQGCQYGSRYFR